MVITHNSTLSTAEGLQILSILAHRAPCGAPAIFRGELPIRLEQIIAWRQGLAAAPSPLVDAILSATLFAEAILAPLAHWRRLGETVHRWRLGEAFQSLSQFLARSPNPGVTSDWVGELEIHLQACRDAIPNRRRGRHARRGRLLRAIESLYQPLRAWDALPAAAETFLKGGRPADAARLQELLDCAAKSLARRQQRIVEKLGLDLSGCNRPAPALPELLRALELMGELLKGARCDPSLSRSVRQAQHEILNADRVIGKDMEAEWRVRFDEIVKRIVHVARLVIQDASPQSVLREAILVLENYLGRRRAMWRIRRNLARLLESPPPRIPARERRRRRAQLADLSRRWFRAGARATAARLGAIAPPTVREDSSRLGAVSQILEQLENEKDIASGYREADRLAEVLAAPLTSSPAGETLAFLLESCAVVQAAAQSAPPAAIPDDLGEGVGSFSRLADWTASMGSFVQRRLASFDESQRRAFREFLSSGRFSIRPPNGRDLNDLLAWLLAIPVREREGVLEFLYLGPVRREVLRAALTIAEVESAARRFPRLSPEQFAACVATLDGAGDEMIEILVRKLITPLLSHSEQQQFEKRLKILRSRRERSALPLDRRIHARFATDDAAPFFESPRAVRDTLERSRRRAALELSHSLWKAGVLEESDYRGVIDQHWRRAAARANRWDRDRSRPSLVEQMILRADQTCAAAAEAGDPPPALAALVWAVWGYAKSDENIKAWREHVPLGRRRGARLEAPLRTEAGDPGETIEHIRVTLLKFFDLGEIVARARGNHANATEDELHDARAVDLLLFDMFGEDGMLLPAAVYAAPLTVTARQALETLEPLAAQDGEMERICEVLSVLTPFYADYCPWAEALRFWQAGPAETIARWRGLLDDARSAARRMARSPALAGELLPAWRAAAELLENRQHFLRLQMAVRIAVERDDPTCRHLCASRPLLAQLDAERVGLAIRRRLHPRSEGAILAAKLESRRQAILDLPAAQACLQSLAESLAGDCRTLLVLHASPAAAGRRKSVLECTDEIGRKARELRSMLDATGAASRRDEDEPLVEAACAAAATARDLSDGFYLAKQHKGLRTLLAIRRGDRLDDMLSRT